MKIKRVIEIEESDYELSRQRYGDARYNGHQPDYENTAIAQSKPYNPSGDAISREALKKAIEPYRYAICGFEGVLALIDNAQAVEPERRKGEWIEYNATGKKQYMCSECSMKEKNPKFARYCYWCGAKMKGSAE